MTPTTVARRASLAGALLGVVAGLVELTTGPSIRSWVGDKQDTTRLGITTTLLALIALTAALYLRRALTSPGQRLAIAAGLLVPGLIGFTTVGRLWLVPGPLLVTAGVLVASSLRTEITEVRHVLAENWGLILTGVLAVEYIALGATALGRAGALGILGGAAILVLLASPSRIGARGALLCLIAATLPFAALTWWSIATPIIALLLLAIGAPAIYRRARTVALPTAVTKGESNRTHELVRTVNNERTRHEVALNNGSAITDTPPNRAGGEGVDRGVPVTARERRT